MLLLACVAVPMQAAIAQAAPEASLPPAAHGSHREARGDRLFVSPMGEPFRGAGDNAARWFAAADADHDGRLTRGEFVADANRFFGTLDVDRDGEIGPDEITRYETEIVPEVASEGLDDAPGRSGRGAGRGPGGGRHGGGGGRGGSGGGWRSQPDGQGDASSATASIPRARGAARYGYLDLPEPVIAADADFNRGVSRAEFDQAAFRRFQLLDTDGDGVLVPSELPHPNHAGGPGHARRGKPWDEQDRHEPEE